MTGLASARAAVGAAPYDGHEPPATGPMPGVDPAPTPEPMPGADPAPTPAPAPLDISIIGFVGPGAFMPNPTQASAGDLVLWTNNDVRPHHIVLADGTDVGMIEPGMSSAPVALVTGAASYHCTLHPSMVGSIADASAPAPPPVEEPPYVPPYEPPDNDYYY